MSSRHFFTFLGGQRKKIGSPTLEEKRRAGVKRVWRTEERGTRKCRRSQEVKGRQWRVARLSQEPPPPSPVCGTEIYVAVKAGYSLLYGALPVTQPRRPPGSHLTTLTFTLTQQQATSSPPLFPLGLPPSDYRPLPSLLHLPYKCGDTASLRGERLSPFLTLSLYFSTSLHVSGSALAFFLPLGRVVKYIIDFLELRPPDFESTRLDPSRGFPFAN